MPYQIPDNLYIVHYKPSNRREKRIAQKEYEKIQYHCLPIVLAYMEEKEKTDQLRLFARDEYMKRCELANRGNQFVTADPFFFSRHFPTQQQIKQIIKPSNRQRTSAIAILILISAIVIGIIIDLLTR